MGNRWQNAEYKRWRESPERLKMSLAERALYRECLDIHYEEGSITADYEALVRQLGITGEEFASAWPAVFARLRPLEGNPDRLVSPEAVEALRQAEAYRKGQAKHGKKGGRKPVAEWARKGRRKGTLRLPFSNTPKPTPKTDDKTGDTKGYPKATLTSAQTPMPIDRGGGLAFGHPEVEKGYPSTPETTDKGTLSGDVLPPPVPLPPLGGGEGQTPNEVAIPAAVISVKFEEWWQGYPRQAEKAEAYLAYEELVAYGIIPKKFAGLIGPNQDFESRHIQLVGATKVYANGEFAERTQDVIPYPATFLRKLGWLSAPRTLKDWKMRPVCRAWETKEQYNDRLRKEGFLA